MIRLAEERLQMKCSPYQSPGVGHVCDYHCSRALSCIPEHPFSTEWLRKGQVLRGDGAGNRKDTQREREDQQEFALSVHMRLQDHRYRYAHDHEIRAEVESKVEDQVVQCRGALYVRGRRLPVVVEGPAPISEVQYFHHNIRGSHVGCHQLHHKVLRKILRQTPVQYKQARFRSPLYSAHALLNQKHSFASPCPLLDVLLCQVRHIVRRNEVCVDSCIDIEKDDENGIEAGQEEH